MILPGHPSAPTIDTVRVNDSAPSRKRELQGMWNMAAAGTQPSGTALPSLFPGRILSMSDHVGFAVNLSPRNVLLREAIPQFAWGIAQSTQSNAASVIEKRTASLSYFRKLEITLKEANGRWLSSLPEGSPSSNVDFALIHFLVTNLKYPDTSLAEDLGRWMQLVGDVPPTGVFAKRARDPRVSVPEWRQGIEERNRAMIRRVAHSSNQHLTRACW